MKKFRFRLEPLLRHRALLEKQALSAFALAQQSLAALRSRASNLQGMIAGDAPGCDVRAYFQRIDSAMRMRAQTLQHITAATDALEPRRASLVAAMRDRRALQMLKERAYAAHRVAVERAQECESEEIARSSISRAVL
ncbi:MAG TPA: flagellar FliJ family protein [Candidatus Baltobacteraceae bacterium]|nr:flagellar FliJ family protein [Candidatus Baltobacteraceae bacterium]